MANSALQFRLLVLNLLFLDLTQSEENTGLENRKNRIAIQNTFGGDMGNNQKYFIVGVERRWELNQDSVVLLSI